MVNVPCGFNPRTPCGVRRMIDALAMWTIWFQSTHSLRSATSMYTGACHEYAVSIHALLAECDSQHVSYLRIIQCFNPRTPCGVRLPAWPSCPVVLPFQSTHSLRSATLRCHSSRLPTCVSIHALLAECDNWPGSLVPQECMFQSTHSLRSATDNEKKH